MRISSATLVFVAALATVTSLGAQSDSALRRLDFLVGEWTGSGWIQQGGPQRLAFNQHESVRYAAGGTVIVIDGLGKSADPRNPEKIVHQAFAIITYDAKTNAFHWRAYRAGGEEISIVPVVSPGKLVWGFKPEGSGGEVRFTITLSASGEWIEIGEFSRDGTTWAKFMEMTLHH